MLKTIDTERPTMSPRYLTQVELAVRWRISPRTLERWRWAGEGPRFLKVSGKVLYRIEDIEAFEAAHVRSSTDESAAAVAAQSFAPKRGKQRNQVVITLQSTSGRHSRLLDQ
jgi:hypothetical protein